MAGGSGGQLPVGQQAGQHPDQAIAFQHRVGTSEKKNSVLENFKHEIKEINKTEEAGQHIFCPCWPGKGNILKLLCTVIIAVVSVVDPE